ncbi:MAG: 3-hydroxyacyl-CoA dehydrogenase [Candidatus Hydrogenedentota bacterium]
MEVAGKTFLVTGGASGLGEGTVRLLAGLGANIVIADVNEERGRAVAGELGECAMFSPTDVTGEAYVKKTIQATTDRFGTLHGAINCAGVGVAIRTLSKMGPHPLDAFETVIHINLIGTFNVLRLASHTMAQNEPDENGERGVIVNTASVAAYDGQIGQIAYSASKAGVVGLTLPAARDLARHAIRVVTIAPGLFDTPLLAALPEENRQNLVTHVPFPNRLGMASEFAALVRHVIENSMLNGETIRLDGALRMPPK